MSKIFFDSIPILKVSDEQDQVFRAALKDIECLYTEDKAIAIDKMIFDAYHLDDEDVRIIGYIKIE